VARAFGVSKGAGRFAFSIFWGDQAHGPQAFG